jgi:hypothetical protein
MMSVRIYGLANKQGVVRYNRFDEVRNFLSAIPYIDAGGCGISAYAMYLWLKKENQMPQDFKFVFLHYNCSADNFYSNRSALENGSGRIYAPEHVAIKYKGEVIDSENVLDTDDFGLFFEIPLEKAEDYLVNSLNTDDWNNWFDRPKFTKIIEKELGIEFSPKLRRKSRSWD